MHQAILLRTLLFLILVHSMTPHGSAVGQWEPPKIDQPHPPLALWTIDHDKPVSLESLRGQKVVLIHFASWSPKCREEVPGWFERTRAPAAAKKLVVLGVDHEQHADRCRLFAQWKELKEIILHDSLDLSGATKLPLVVAIDEEGIVRAIHPTIDPIEKTFLHRAAPPKKNRGSEPEEAALPDPRLARRMAGEARQSSGYRELADALVLAGLPPQIDEAVTVYRHALQLDPKDAWSFFRLGVAYRIRFDRAERQAGDFQAAADAWEQAVRLAPTCEVFRQRSQQYGPPVQRTEAFYDWIPPSRIEIERRGVKPIELDIEPLAMELSLDRPSFAGRSPPTDKDKAQDDKEGLVQIEPAVVRATDRKHTGASEVHLTLWPSGVEWDNRSTPLRIRLEKPKSAKLQSLFFEFPNPNSQTSDEPRTVSFEVETKGKSGAKVTLSGYAVYSVRAGQGGKAKTLRQEFKVTIGGKPEYKAAKTNDKRTKKGEKRGTSGEERM